MDEALIAHCLVCSSKFNKRPKKSNKYCCIDCYRIAQRRGDYKQPIENLKHQNVCHGCNKVTNRPPAKGRDGEDCQRVFCNNNCYSKYRVVSQFEILSPK